MNFNFVLKWGSEGSGIGQFKLPAGIAVDSYENIYIADKENHRVQKFDSQGRILTKWGSMGGEDGQFTDPGTIAVDKQGYVYVCDIQISEGGGRAPRMQKFDPEGKFLAKYLIDGMASGLAADKSGNLYINYGDRICKLDSNGRLQAKFGIDGVKSIWQSQGIAVDGTGKIYVADTGNQCIKIYDIR